MSVESGDSEASDRPLRKQHSRVGLVSKEPVTPRPRSFGQWAQNHMCVLYACASLLAILLSCAGLAVPLAMCEVEKAGMVDQCAAFPTPPAEYDGSIPRLLVRFHMPERHALDELPAHIRRAVNMDGTFTLDSHLEVIDFAHDEEGWANFRRAFEFLASTRQGELDALMVDQLVHKMNGTAADGHVEPTSDYGLSGAETSEDVTAALLSLSSANRFAYGTNPSSSRVDTSKWWMVGGAEADPMLHAFVDSSGNEQAVSFGDVLPTAGSTVMPYQTHQLYSSGVMDAWELMGGNLGNPEIIVAILDTGVDINHEDLADRIWTNPGEIPGDGIDNDGNGKVDDVYGWDFGDNDADVADPDGHGTHCAGVVAMTANNGKGGVGVAPGVRIMPLKLLDGMGNMYFSATYAAMAYAKANGAHILSNSYATVYSMNFDPEAVNPDNPYNPNWMDSVYYEQTFSYEVGKLEDAGTLFVTAGGNSHSNNTKLDVYNYHFLPGNIKRTNVMTVGWMMEDNFRLAPQASWGANPGGNILAPRGQVHVGAPGTRVYSSTPGNAYAHASGSSVSTPVAAGVSALVLTALCVHRADPACLHGRAVDVRRILCESSDDHITDVMQSNGSGLPIGLTPNFENTRYIDVRGDFMTCGTINARAAVALALSFAQHESDGLALRSVDPMDASDVRDAFDLVPEKPVRVEVYDSGEAAGAATLDDVDANVYLSPALAFMTSAMLDFPRCADCNGLIGASMLADAPDLGSDEVLDLSGAGHIVRFTTIMEVRQEDLGTHYFCVELGPEDSASLSVGGKHLGTVTTTASTESECLPVDSLYVANIGYVKLVLTYMQVGHGTPQGVSLKHRRTIGGSPGALDASKFLGPITHRISGSNRYEGIAKLTYPTLQAPMPLTLAIGASAALEAAHSAFSEETGWRPTVEPADGLTVYRWLANMEPDRDGNAATLTASCRAGLACELRVGGVTVAAVDAASDGVAAVAMSSLPGDPRRAECELLLLAAGEAGLPADVRWNGGRFWSSVMTNPTVPVPAAAAVAEPSFAHVAGVNHITTYEGSGDSWRRNIAGTALGWNTVPFVSNAQAAGTTSSVRSWQQYTQGVHASVRRIAVDAHGVVREVAAIRFSVIVPWANARMKIKAWVGRADGSWWETTAHSTAWMDLADVGEMPSDFLPFRVFYIAHSHVDVAGELCFDAAPDTDDCVPIDADNAVVPIDTTWRPRTLGYKLNTLRKNPNAYFTPLSSGFMGQFWSQQLRWRWNPTRGKRTQEETGLLDGSAPKMDVAEASTDDICMVRGTIAVDEDGWYTFRFSGLDALSAMEGVNLKFTLGSTWGWGAEERNEWRQNYMTAATVYEDPSDGHGLTAFATSAQRDSAPAYLTAGDYNYVLYTLFPSGAGYRCAHSVQLARTAAREAPPADADFAWAVSYSG